MQTGVNCRTSSLCLQRICLTQDIFNGKMLSILSGEMSAEPGASPASSLATPSEMLTRWNFRHAGGRFVEGSPPLLSLRLWPRGTPTPIDCPLMRSAQIDVPKGSVCAAGAE